MMTAGQKSLDFDLDPNLDGVILEFVDEIQGAALLDQRSRERLGISGLEFARSYCAGELGIEAPHAGMLYFLLEYTDMECNAGPDAV